MNINEIFENLNKIYSSGNSSQAEVYLLSCLKEASSAGDSGAIIIICNELGGYYRAVGKYEDGYPLYETALAELSKINMLNTDNHAVTLINYATCYAVSGKSEKALEIFRQAAEIMTSLYTGPNYELATLNNNMSIVCQDMGDNQQALVYLNKALDILRSLTESEVEIAITYTNMAQIHLQMGNVEESYELISQAIEIFQDSSLPLDLTQDVHYSGAIETLGHIYMAKGDEPSGLECFKKALELTARDYGTDSAAYEALNEFIKEYTGE